MLNWFVTGYGYKDVEYVGDTPYGTIAEGRSMLVDVIEDWLAEWDREFAYHDRQASKRRWPKP